jgi:hypothetical protein
MRDLLLFFGLFKAKAMKEVGAGRDIDGSGYVDMDEGESEENTTSSFIRSKCDEGGR